MALGCWTTQLKNLEDEVLKTKYKADERKAGAVEGERLKSMLVHSDNTQRSTLLLSFLHCRVFLEKHFKNSSITSAASVQQASKRKDGPGQCVACVWCERKTKKLCSHRSADGSDNADHWLLHRFFLFCFVSQLKRFCTHKMHTNTLFFSIFPTN